MTRPCDKGEIHVSPRQDKTKDGHKTEGVYIETEDNMIFDRDCVLGRFFFEVPLCVLVNLCSLKKHPGLEKDTFQDKRHFSNLHYFLDGSYSNLFRTSPTYQLI